MKRLLIGIFIGIVGLAGGVFLFLRLGLLEPGAARPPSQFERVEAMKFLDAALTRYAPRRSNPFPASETNLLAGMRIYKAHCALCHGDPAHPRSAVGLALYPRAPQFLEEAPDMPEYQNVYIIRNGVRWTGMPGWKNVLSKDDIWKITAFLAGIRHLPPVVDEEWKSTVAPKSGTPAVKEKGTNRHE